MLCELKPQGEIVAIREKAELIARLPGRKFVLLGPRAVSVLAQALLPGEATALVRKAIELALAGDVQMLKFLLDNVRAQSK